MHPKRIAILIALATGIFAPSAHALTFTEQQKLSHALPTARAAWPTSPCAGREVIHLAVDPQVIREKSPDGRHYEGLSLAATCEVWLIAGMLDETFCGVLVHELGHLAGYDHAAPFAIMTDAFGHYPPCDLAMRPTIDEQLRDALPHNGEGWRIGCHRPRDVYLRCSATRKGFRKRILWFHSRHGGVSYKILR